MRLLLDNNLSHKLVGALEALYPGITHLRDLEMRDSPDEIVWNYARQNNCCLVTKDADFNELLSTHGFPPKVLWLRVGNCTTSAIVELFINHYSHITHFLQDDQFGLLELW